MKRNFNSNISPEYLKIPDNLAFVCNKKKVFKLVEFWLYAKLLNANGKVYKTDYEGISELTGLCRQTVKLNLKKCIQNGLAVVVGDHIQLISKDKMWQWLGYEVVKEPLQLVYNGSRVGFHRLFVQNFISLNVSLKDYICYKSVYRNLEIQKLVIRSNVSGSLYGTKKYARITRRKVKMLELGNYSVNRKLFPHINFDVTLSYEGISKLLGLGSSKSAFDLIQRLNRAGLLKYIRRIHKVKEFNPYKSAHFVRNGKVYINRPNLYRFIAP